MSKLLTSMATARKSDTFLHTNSAAKSRPSESTVRPQLLGNDQHTKLEGDSSTSKEALRERLSRLFSEPKRRESIDLSNATGVASAKQKQSGDPQHEMINSSTSGLRSGAASVHSLALKDVPDRRSSLAPASQGSLQDFPSWRLPGPAAAGRCVPPRGRAESPIKRSISKGPISSDALRPSSSRTFIRSTPPLRLLDLGNITHRRLQLSTSLKAPLFVGGGTVEGYVKLAIDHPENSKDRSKPLHISKLSVDIVGVEEVGDSRK